MSAVAHVGARGVETDKRDARALSETACLIDLPSVHVPSYDARARKELCAARESLLLARTQLVNCPRAPPCDEHHTEVILDVRIPYGWNRWTTAPPLSVPSE